MGATSARGLFRATGKTAKPVLVHKGEGLGGNFERAEFRAREKDDFYPTPVEPTQSLVAAEHERLNAFPAIWEPAAGDGAMAGDLETAGLTVLKSDMIDRGCGAEIRNFYDYKTAPSKAIVTNPPFDECWGRGPWVLHALEVLGAEYMALLLPLNWPGAKERAETWAKYPPVRVYLMRWRIDFTGQGAPPMLNAWFVWERGNTQPPQLLMLDKTDKRQMALFEEASA